MTEYPGLTLARVVAVTLEHPPEPVDSLAPPLTEEHTHRRDLLLLGLVAYTVVAALFALAALAWGP